MSKWCLSGRKRAEEANESKANSQSERWWEQRSLVCVAVSKRNKQLNKAAGFRCCESLDLDHHSDSSCLFPFHLFIPLNSLVFTQSEFLGWRQKTRRWLVCFFAWPSATVSTLKLWQLEGETNQEMTTSLAKSGEDDGQAISYLLQTAPWTTSVWRNSFILISPHVEQNYAHRIPVTSSKDIKCTKKR